MKLDLTEEDIDQLFNLHFRNRCFQVRRDLQDLQELFHMLSQEKIVLLDRYMIVERQLKLAKREADNLVSVLKKVEDDFEAKDECTCPKICDCQYPPPPNGEDKGKGGAYSVSMSCPVHNDNPDPDPECPVHGDKSDER